MEFLVEMRTVIPADLAAGEETRLRDAERAAIARLAERGWVHRLWRTHNAGGGYTVGLWEAPSEDALRAELALLPLHPFMGLAVRALDAHDNDPGR